MVKSTFYRPTRAVNDTLGCGQIIGRRVGKHCAIPSNNGDVIIKRFTFRSIKKTSQTRY